jgi:hypothetical protein
MLAAFNYFLQIKRPECARSCHGMGDGRTARRFATTITPPAPGYGTLLFAVNNLDFSSIYAVQLPSLASTAPPEAAEKSMD